MQINKKTGNIIGEYFDEAFKNNRLFSFEVDLDQRCNANCVFCFQGEKTPNTKERMSLGKYKELFLEAKQLGGYYIGFAGGEPFCNPNALDIMEMAQIFGYRVGVITNGHLLDNQMIERLIQMNLSRISISFHGFKKETYARHFGVDERFYNEVVNKIIQLVNGGCHVGIAYTVTKNNIDEFFDTKKMFMDIGLSGKDIKFNMLIQGDKDVQHLYPSVEQLEKLINLDREYFIENEIVSDYSLLCSAARCSFAVNVHGDVFPCNFYNTRAGNLFEESIKKIWEQSHIMRLLRNISETQYIECMDCEIQNHCNLCIIDNLNNTNNYLKPNKKRCMEKIDFYQKLFCKEVLQ